MSQDHDHTFENEQARARRRATARARSGDRSGSRPTPGPGATPRLRVAVGSPGSTATTGRSCTPPQGHLRNPRAAEVGSRRDGGHIQDIPVDLYGNRIRLETKRRARGRPLRKPDALVVAVEYRRRGIQIDRFLNPAEREHFEAFASGASTHADLASHWNVKESGVRKRRERLRKKLTRIIENHKEAQMSEVPTLAERTADHEERIREIERQIGMPPDGDRAAEEAVELLLEDVEDDLR